ncbi:MAG: hypothetical protein VX938_10635, partial [Myxococcota bacterium]|nr:hypothetical protein [Myxococcota bacterium]
MGRCGFSVLCCIFALLGPEIGGEARAAFVWEEVGPSTRKGIQAVAVDPVDPQVVWVTDGTRVWVTDDGGESWQPVMRATFSRSSSYGAGGATRSRGASDGADSDADSSSDDDEAETFRLRPLRVDDDGLGEDGVTRPDGARRSVRRRRSVTPAEIGPRLRVIGDSVYLCVRGGLWVADRSARNLGTDRRLRFGRQVAVFDVVEAEAGALWLSTGGGLMHLDARERATAVPGSVGDRAVVTTRVLEQGLLVATAEGLWSGWSGRVQRLGLSLDAARDLVVLSEHRVVVCTAREVALISLVPGASPEVLASWPMAGVSRLAVDRNQVLWAAGSGGVWSRTLDLAASWEPRDAGLRDRRIAGLAATRGTVRLWLVGSGGAWRRISERVQAERAGDRRGFLESEGAPGVWRTLSVAQRQRFASLDHLRNLRLAQSTAWVLPDVNVSYTNYFARDETALFVDELDQLLL